MSGLLAERGFYKEGKKEGLFEEYRDESGLLFSRGIYKNDKLDGVLTIWDSTGGLLKRELYKDGERVRSLRTAEVVSMNGRQQATLSRIKANDQYPERGEIELLRGMSHKLYFERLSQDGLCERWYESGRLMSVRQEDEYGIPCGISEEWSELGELKKRCNYKSGGLLNGLYETWWDEDQIRVRANYKDGKLDGLYEEWYPDGQIEERANYKADRQDGISEQWWEDGRLLSRENYKDGRKHGLCERMAPICGKINQYIYKDGVIQSGKLVDHFSDLSVQGPIKKITIVPKSKGKSGIKR